MKAPNISLLRERLTYSRPTFNTARRPAPEIEWRLDDRFGNRHGRFLFRPAASEEGAEPAPWSDVFGHDIHCGGYVPASSFCAIVTADDRSFSVHRVDPFSGAKEILRQPGKLEPHGLSADQQFLLLKSATAEDWLRPHLLVLTLDGRIVSRLPNVAGIPDNWAGQWSPLRSDQRIVFGHEQDGYLTPALWSPFESRVESLGVQLEGETSASWDRAGAALILKRSLQGRSDLHRLNLQSRTLTLIQPRDGTILHHGIDDCNRVVGLWTSGGSYAESFVETERTPAERFHPSAPLHGWQFKTVAGVPCFIVRNPTLPPPRWTVFDGYGGPAYHHIDAYNRKVVALVDHGYQVVLVNTRGCSGFGRVWRESTLGNIGLTEIDDLRRVRAALVEEGAVHPDRAILTGDSWGGYMTLLAMGLQPDLWRMGVAFLPVGDFENAFGEATPLIRPLNLTQFGGSPATHREAYRKASPLSYTEKIRAPILIFAGKYDLLCPPNQIKTFAESLRARGGTCELQFFEGGHGSSELDERARQAERMLEFLAQHGGESEP